VTDFALHELRLGLVLFFVLSGFLLWQPWVRAANGSGEPPRPGAFLLRRAARIMPAYYAALAGSVLLLWGLAGTPGVRLPDGELLALFSVFAQNYSPGSVMKLDPPMWTIAIEASFYVVLPVLGWLALRRRRGVIAVPVLFAVFGVAWNAMAMSHGLGMTWTKTLPAMAPYFAVGMLAAALWQRPVGRWNARLLIGFGLALVCVDAGVQSAAAAGGPVLLPALLRDLPAAVGCALLIAGVARARFHGGFARVLASRPVATTGTLSYGLYLWHVPVLLWLRGNGLLPLNTIGATAVALPMSLALAAASWRRLERPAIRRAREPFIGRSRALATVTGQAH
jgi:peptidoglycan/LPS O-acetylase OafA/YrhL